MVENEVEMKQLFKLFVHSYSINATELLAHGHHDDSDELPSHSRVSEQLPGLPGFLPIQGKAFPLDVFHLPSILWGAMKSFQSYK